MVKIPELLGLVLVAIMTLAFVGAFRPQVEMGLSPVFWACAVGAFMIVFYRKWKKKQEEKEK
jgi:FtsH-binding integral membrane protein